MCMYVNASHVIMVHTVHGIHPSMSLLMEREGLAVYHCVRVYAFQVQGMIDLICRVLGPLPTWRYALLATRRAWGVGHPSSFVF